MYAWLSIKPDRTPPELQACWYCLATSHVPEVSPADLDRRAAAVAAIVKTACTDMGNAGRTQLLKQVAPMARYYTGDADSIDFAIHMAVAHQRLPQTAREVREQTVETLIHGYFGELTEPPAWLTDRLAMLRATALLAPDAQLIAYVRSECANHWLALLREQIANGASTAATAGLDRLHRAIKLADAEHATAILDVMCLVHAVCPPQERTTLSLLLISMAVSGNGGAVGRAVTAMQGLASSADITLRTLGLIEILRKVLAHSKLPEGERMPLDEIIAAQDNQMRQQQARASNQTLVQTVAALRAGVPMGMRGEQSRAALATLASQLQATDERMTPARLRSAQRVAAPEPLGRPASGDAPPTDLDPVHSWSVNRLLQWIEGPLVNQPGATARRIDRANIANRERRAREQRIRDSSQRHKTSRPPAARPVPAPDFTAADIELVVQDALAATARFFLDDIDELLPLATTLQAPADLIEACRALREPLRALLHTPASANDELARTQLGQAEAAIAQLRQGIRSAEVEQLKQERFDNRLAKALATEVLELGKRHGGVIDCRMTAADWPWVVQTYHRCWLPQARLIRIDGTVVALPPDQALALYVTGSSRSDHAFDVSVHLWRRRPGGTSPPGHGEALYPPMNTDDWFDTYLPCCVLHVPG